VKNVGTVLVDENACSIVVIVGIPAMVSDVNDQGSSCQTDSLAALQERSQRCSDN